ncbi:exonuclease II Exo2 [Coemansia sp. RSA 2399]|nr:exonuclease II Exo2 [Coemansia sp. RSA 2399]
MGVPGLMRWLQQQFPLACQQISRLDSSYFRKTHSLCIDLNGTLHRNAQQTNGDVTSVSEAIEMIVRLVKPQHTLYLAIDGVPPRIKERLQRERRERRMVHHSHDKFNTYAITPGTRWMRQVEQHLAEFIERKRRSDAEWWGLRVVLSGYGDPGEGEQKIMDYLSQIQGAENQGVHYVWSNDADTVLLSLGTHVRNIVLVNDRNMDSGRGFLAVTDIDRLTDSLVDRYKPTGACSTESARRRLVDDLVFMSFFAGNDFLPPISLVTGAADGDKIDRLWALYSKLPASCQGFLQSGGDINYSALFGLLKWIEETHEKREFQKHVGVTMLGPQLTSMRIRRMAWEQQRAQSEDISARSTSSDATLTDGAAQVSRCTCSKAKSRKSSSKSRTKARCAKVSCSCNCHRGKQRTSSRVPFMWTGPLSQLDISGAQMREDGDVAALDGSRVLGSGDNPKWHPVAEDMECPFLTLNGLPLLCPALVDVFKIMVSLASGGDMAASGGKVAVEMLRRIDSNRAKWLHTAGIMLGQDIKFYDASTRSDAFEALCKSWTDQQQQQGTDTVAVVFVAHMWPGSDKPSSIVSIQPSSTNKTAHDPSLAVALVGSDAWDLLQNDGRTEHRRDHELLKWKDAFYRQSYGSAATHAAKLSACYADALAWTCLYYFARRVGSWQFVWPEDIESALSWVAPLASDLSAHLKQQGGSCNVRWDLAPDSEGSPPLLREHLLSVLPCEAWASTLTDSECELAKHLVGCKFSAEARQWVHAQLLATPGSNEPSVVRVWI